MTSTVTARADARLAAADWEAVTRDLDERGGALLPPLLTAAEAARLRELYDQPGRFRSTVDMARHRFGEGQYRYFATPYPEPIERLEQALYPRLLPSPATGGKSSGGRRRGRTPWTNGSRCATRRDRSGRRRSCSATDRATGTPCTVIFTATWSSRCRWSST